jgi:hypothetical protein
VQAARATETAGVIVVFPIRQGGWATPRTSSLIVYPVPGLTVILAEVRTVGEPIR